VTYYSPNARREKFFFFHYCYFPKHKRTRRIPRTLYWTTNGRTFGNVTRRPDNNDNKSNTRIRYTQRDGASRHSRVDGQKKRTSDRRATANLNKTYEIYKSDTCGVRTRRHTYIPPPLQNIYIYIYKYGYTATTCADYLHYSAADIIIGPSARAFHSSTGGKCTQHGPTTGPDVRR